MSLSRIILAVSSLLNFNISSFFLGEIRLIQWKKNQSGKIKIIDFYSRYPNSWK